MRNFVLINIFLATLFYPVFIFSQSHSVQKGMVVSEQKLASKVGAEILRAGGNAIDAAVAVGYALAVVTPCCGNIGGGGFMLIHLANGENVFLNFREKAPLKSRPNMFLDSSGKPIPNASTKGFLAVAVPGTVMGLDKALQKYGTMQRKEVMAPAIQLAEKGYIVTSYQASLFQTSAQTFKKYANVAAIFLKNGKPYQAGERLIQKELAGTLKLIADQGPNAFYKGPIASAIVKDSNANGGILTLEDFANYNIEETKPLYCNYQGYRLITAAPPSSGGITLCEMLNILENFPLKSIGYHSKLSFFYIIEAMRYAYLDRNNNLGDPDFVHNPSDRLTSKKYAKEISQKITAAESLPINDAVQESTETTHYSVLDNKGNAVAVTYTLDGLFGAGVIGGNTGFFLNNEMDDFSAGENVPNQFGLLQSKANDIEPGKRPLSSMTPTIVMKNGQLILIVGSPGGPRIITSVLQTILNLLDFGMPIQEAVDAPRFHYQVTPNVVFVEPLAVSFFVKAWLEFKGYHLLPENPWSAVEAISIDPKTFEIHGGSDYRRPDGSVAVQ